jgi:V/A-type H+/Na+-transporting ATPase subunit C
MVRLSENPEYGFAIGRVRALEPSLMDRARYERFVRARGDEEFAAALAETIYARFLDARAAGVSGALDKASEENGAFFSQYAQEDWLLNLSRLPAVLRSLKANLKDAAAHGSKNTAVPAGLTATQQAVVVGFITAALSAFEESRDPSVLDAGADRLLQELQLQAAETSEFVLAYLGLHADLENIRTLLRIKAPAGSQPDRRPWLEGTFLPGGALALKDMLASLDEPLATAVDRFSKNPPGGCGSDAFRDYLEQGSAAVTGRRSFVRVERLGREMELRFLRRTRYETFGYEPLLAFFLLRENELRNLRLLYAATLAGLPDEETRDLIAHVE